MSLLIPPPLVMFFTGCLMWLLAALVPGAVAAYPGQLPLVVVATVVGLALMALAVLSFARARTTVNPLRPARASSLVTSGVFALSRNPIYLADLLWLVAWALWLGHPGNVLLLAFFAWYLTRFQILPEEQALAGLFGEDYAAYCRRVRRWL